MQDQNLALYRVFYAVAKNKNITKAAKELFISQPAISKDISKLEANLNCTLFLRTSRGVSLTKEGELLFHHIHSAFSSIEAGEYALKQAQDLKTGQVRIGVSSTLCRYILMPYIKNFIELYDSGSTGAYYRIHCVFVYPSGLEKIIYTCEGI